jgi:hypothetical protein
MNFTRRYQNQPTANKLAVGSAILFIVIVVIPAVITHAHAGDATLTIITDKELPLEFTLADNQGFPSGPLLLDCRIEVKNGVGRFLTGSRNDMNSYGFPPTYWTLYSRLVAVERVDAKGRLVSREVSRLNHVFYFGFNDDPSAPLGQRFFVRNSETP